MGIDYANYDLLIEACMDWIAQKWTKSMIRAELRDQFGKDIDWRTCQQIITAAKKEIKRKYNIDASEYRGHQISLYEFIIRERKYYEETIKLVERLKAAERLDKLFNLEGIQLEDADAVAERIRAALLQMDKNQFSEVPGDAVDKLERLRKTYNDAQRTQDAKRTDGQEANDGGVAGETNEQNSGQQEPSTSETAESEQSANQKAKSVSGRSEGTEGDNSNDIEDVASIDDLPQEIKDLISNPDNKKAFDDFSKRKKRRKDLG